MKKFFKVRDKNLAYIDEGEGDAIVFIHGNPTSSYLWRNIAPNFNSSHRVIVPDLMGMGDSEKLDGIDNPGYSFNGQYDYLEKLLNDLDLGKRINLVVHDWGCGLGLKYARLHSDRISSITFMEGVTVPLTWDQWPEAGTKIFKLFRSDAGEELILDKNFFVERLLFNDPIKPMSEETRAEYLRPFINSGEDRRPTLTFPRNIPFNEEPLDTHNEIKMNANFHSASNIPKLFVNADPGFLLIGSQRDEVRSWVNIKEVTVDGNHFIQEDSPEDITMHIKDFLASL
ncbi:haloalkane dehalogenase [Gammaproteobacteria bacterium]|nr:haloalkane dehalogenase [Gammaproteobacteria bacterium]MDC0440496.1 haloalkane dehalogenase [Gammaproteobacteria bacterium]MDC0443638.1 haloalkane dehalogenase [Gammaproteobacteria bacterium]MDC0884321.1 haloalkane dehalogenase [Gammaproteobacteria bacterium]MDC1021626.1 haloalkane dehalogenase [Gammaproteobacteria bacterium]